MKVIAACGCAIADNGVQAVLLPCADHGSYLRLRAALREIAKAGRDVLRLEGGGINLATAVLKAESLLRPEEEKGT